MIVRVEQGYEIARPSLLYLKAEKNQERIDVSVGGKVVMVAKGQLCIPCHSGSLPVDRNHQISSVKGKIMDKARYLNIE
jgi:hypothetical protein